MTISRIVYFILFVLSIGALLLAWSIWFSLMFGPDQGLGGVGSAIAVGILFIFTIILEVINFFIGKHIFMKEGNRKYRTAAVGFLILLPVLFVVESIVRYFI